MSDHLSPLALDEVAAGLSSGEPHLSGCEACRAKVAELKASNAALVARPEAGRQLGALLPAEKKNNLLRIFAVVAPLAAGLVLFFAWPTAPQPGDGDRLKGAPTISLRDAQGNAVTKATPGQRLTLSVGAAGFSRVTVSSTAADGGHETLFSGGVESGAQVGLMELEVTPGDVELTAEFSDGTRTETAKVRLEVR